MKRGERVYFTCKTCGIEANRLKLRLKGGPTPEYCCRECKVQGQAHDYVNDPMARVMHKRFYDLVGFDYRKKNFGRHLVNQTRTTYDTKIRTCLRCRVEFESIGNRMCSPCQRVAANA
jgi:hypothetical protein